MDKTKYKHMIGPNNPRWNNGNSAYPNHADFKRARIEVLKRTKGKCEICGEPAILVHHIDGNKANHNLDNLIALCRQCHTSLHYANDEENVIMGRGICQDRPTKYSQELGISVKEIAEKFGVTINAVYYWIKDPAKKQWLKEKIKEKYPID